MKRIFVNEKDNFLEKIDDLLEDKNIIFCRIITWQDGDGFPDICQLDGGYSSKTKTLYGKKDEIYKFEIKNDLFLFLEDLFDMEYFSSVNHIYKLGFDICIQCKSLYFVYCPVLKKGYYMKLNYFNRVFGFFNYKEPWENEKFPYWIPSTNPMFKSTPK